MSRTPFPKVEGGYPFPQLELETLESWRRDDIFRRSSEARAGGPEFVFYDGPPTANNVPHVGHVITRVVKDLIPRYRTMQGDHVARKAGWDTHGLPVEIEIEKQLGFTQKAQIEDYGIAEFNALCLESVDRYEKDWRAMVERIGHWIDLDDPYFTYTNTYIESAWWALKELSEKGLLDQGYKIQPFCARCGTSLSSHEVAQNYQDVDDPSVWVRFPLRDGQTATDVDGEQQPLGAGVRIVAWTTTPWTLLSHAALVVHPAMRYSLVEDPADPDHRLLFAEGLEKPVPAIVTREDETVKIDLRDSRVLATFEGEALLGLLYDRPFLTQLPDDAPADGPNDERGWRVVAADYVTASDGTGVVHTAPLFGEDDYQTGRREGLPEILAIDRRGEVVELQGLEPFWGQGFKQVDPAVIRDLRDRGLLLHTENYRHSYPFCWRCDSPLLYYANSSWFIRTTLAKDRLIEKNREINWYPEHVGVGRFGDWLENLVDWALSRNRYWGTPLPIWLCDDDDCDERHVIGSYEELFAAAGRTPPADLYDPKLFDPHRPGIDAFEWPCSKCEGTMRRVEEVIDAWFDSGAMPFAQHHYPFENREVFEKRFPADFISEAVDQTRGWFFTLHALGVLLFDDVAYRNCVVEGHVNDESGRKMSKRLGNVVEPMQVMEESGADALRWYFYVNNPEIPSRFSGRLVREAAQGFLLPLWNAISFFSIYANLDGWSPGRGEPDFSTRPSLDRWVLLRLGRLVRDVTAQLDAYAIAEAARSIESFLGELTNWYIRRSRNRFWAPDGDPGDAEASADKESAYQALYEVLSTLAGLLAPFTPFVAETLHQRLVRTQNDDAADSVHLADWPRARQGRREDDLEASMTAVQRIVKLGHAARNLHGIKTRQPLRSVTVVAADPALEAAVEPFEHLVCEELNIKGVDWAESRTAYVHHEVTPVFPVLGPRFGKRMPLVKKALQDADGDALAEQLAAGSLEIEIDGETIVLTEAEVQVELIEREGTAVQGDRDLLVALDIELNDALVAEGLAREIVNRLQTARKQADLDYADRIRVAYRASESLSAILDAHREWICAETLAIEIAPASESDDLDSVPIEDQSFEFRIERASADH